MAGGITLSWMDNEVRKRLRWVQLFEGTEKRHSGVPEVRHLTTDLAQVAGAVRAIRSGRFVGESRRPDTSPATRISERERQWIIELRSRGLGSRRIQSELKRSHDFDVSRPTIEKVLRTCEPRPRLARPSVRKGSKRYAKEIPGERIQMDTCKIAPGLYTSSGRCRCRHRCY